LWTDISFNNLFQEGGVDLKFGKKPVELIKRIIKLSTESSKSIVLDFFAGSGTTGQAVMELNSQDKGERQFIIITNNEEVINGEKHKIMTDICYPRIKNVINGYNSKKGLPNSVKYFKTAFVGKNNILAADDADKIELAYKAGGLLAVAENTFDQVERNDYWQIFENEKQNTAVYFREEFSKFDDFIEKVRKLKKPTAVYIFSWEKEFEFNDFDDDKNIKVKTIPQPILEIYQQIYNLI
jgi:adenine-specific DNA-methyltransferase